MNYNGIYTALLTPFDKNNKINEKALEQLVKHNVKLGVTGFYVGGSTAEAFLMSKDERKQIMEIVKATAPDKKLIAHIGSVNENEALELSIHAKELGYDAISSVTPFYYKFSVEEIKGYYNRLAEGSGMPMLVYYIPALAGVSMGGSDIASFLQDDKFIGIKFTANDFFTMEQLKTKFPNKVVFNGYDEMFLSGLAMGADGGIGSTYNFMADKFVKIQDLFAKNEIEAAREVQREANRIITILIQCGVMQAEKEIMNQLGIEFGGCRKPFIDCTAEQKELLAKEVLPYITAL